MSKTTKFVPLDMWYKVSYFIRLRHEAHSPSSKEEDARQAKLAATDVYVMSLLSREERLFKNIMNLDVKITRLGRSGSDADLSAARSQRKSLRQRMETLCFERGMVWQANSPFPG